MQNIRFHFEQVADATREIHDIANNMKDALTTIAETRQGISSAWQGPASSSFNEKLTNLTSNFEKVYNEMQYCVLYLAEVSDGYETIEAALLGEVLTNLNISTPDLSGSSFFGGD